VIAVSATPAFSVDGCNEVSVGTELNTVNKSEFVVLGVIPESKTVIVLVPGCAIRFGATTAVMVCVVTFTCTPVIPVEEPFHRTVEFVVNPLPFNVNVSAPPPTCADNGLIPASANTVVPVSAGRE